VVQNKTQALRPAGKGVVRPGVCDREAEKFVSEKPVRIERSVPAPKKIRDVSTLTGIDAVILASLCRLRIRLPTSAAA
jgi:hypothetical protein